MFRFACLLVFVPFLLAQRQTGELRLTVMDPTGARLEVFGELVSQANQVRMSFSTDPQGRYSGRELGFGSYHLRLERHGFAPYTALIEIRSEVPTEHSVTMGIAPVETVIVVTETSTLLDPRRVGIVSHLGQDTLETRRTSSPSRGVLDLVNTQPGWLLEANGVLHPRGSEYDAQYVIDGIPITDNRSPAFAPAFEVEELESMKILTAGYPAEYGRKLGGVIEVVTARERRPGFRGKAVLQGGSFNTQSGYVSGQFSSERVSGGISIQGTRTDRFLDPPIEQNFTNRSNSGGITGRLENSLTDRDRLRFYLHSKRSGFLVPNELVQQQAGQRQDRTNEEIMGNVSYQRILSPRWLAEASAMVRGVTATLWSNPLSTPILAHQDRGFWEGYITGSTAAQLGRHALKFGTETILTSVRERFGYRITDEEFFEEDGTLEFPLDFRFQDRQRGREHSAYVQDLIQAGDFTFSAGLRWDYYRLTVKENFLSPRLGMAWYLPSVGLVLRGSYDRAVTVPAIENLLLASSEEAQGLTEETTGFPLRPSRGNFYEVGLSQRILEKVRLDGSYFRRNLRHFADDDVFLNTGVSFPISFHHAEIHGFELKLEVPRWDRWSGFASYSNLVSTGFFPITGGLFLDEDVEELLASRKSFPISQDQRNTLRARFRCQLHPKAWAALGFWYNSGLPVEREGEMEDEDALEDEEKLRERFGGRVVDQVDLGTGRVKPSHGFDLSIGVDIWRRDRRSLALQVDVSNLTNRLNLINFAGLFSGTSVGSPRMISARLQADF